MIPKVTSAPVVSDAATAFTDFTAVDLETTDKDRETAEIIAHIAAVLLRRYGVICRRVLEREPLLPPWRDLLYVFRRMEELLDSYTAGAEPVSRAAPDLKVVRT